MSVRGRGFSEYTELEQALEMVLSRISEVGSEELPFDEAAGRVLAEEVKSEVDVPPFDRAAMDGFAVRAEDTFGADENDPNELRVVGSVEVGSKPGLEIGGSEVAEIATGAPVPGGADAVVKLEETRRKDLTLEVFSPASPGKNVSSRGEDVESGQTVLEAGRRLRPEDIGILAVTDNLEVEVKKKPEVGVVTTGDELQAPGESLGPGEITETNSYALGAAVEESGGTPTRLETVPDEIEPIGEVLHRASNFDVLLLTGGTSVGAEDLVPDAISDLGELAFHGVAIRPGGPTAFGIVNSVPVFSLPGFPVASLVSFEMLVRPALREMRGLPPRGFRPVIRAELGRKISSSLGRADVGRVKVQREGEGYRAEPIRVTGSSILRTMTEADGIVVVPEESEGFAEGETVEVRLFDS